MIVKMMILILIAHLFVVLVEGGAEVREVEPAQLHGALEGLQTVQDGDLVQGVAAW